MAGPNDFLNALLPHVEADLQAKWRRDAYREDPVLWAKDMLGVTLWSKQQEILYSIRDNHNTAVAAGHSVGKSFLASIAMAWWADVHPPQDTKILSTAPTFAQVTSILWDNLRKWHIEAKRRHEEYLRRKAAGIALDEYQYNDHALPGYITSGNIWKTELGFEIGIGRKPPDNLLDSAFQGVHAPYLLVIGDEAAGLPPALLKALNNNATGSANRVLLIANPTDPTSEMAKIWKDKNRAKSWTTMNISVWDSPPVTGEEFPFGEADGMSGLDYINQMRNDYGEDDPYYITRVLGQWAFEAGNNVFSDVDLAKAMNTVVIPDQNALPRDGWDIARSEKGDFTVGYRAIEGEIWETDDLGQPTVATGRRGVQVRIIDSWRGAPIVGRDPANPGSSERIDGHALGAATNLVVIDASGLGAGVVDGLRDLGFGRQKYLVFEYWASGASTDNRAYVNARAEHYFALKALMFREEIDLDPADERVIDELRGISYEYTSRGQRKIESKDDMRRRGVKSPDYADAVIYATADMAPLTDGPLAGMEKGDLVHIDPWDLIEFSREDAGYPM